MTEGMSMKPVDEGALTKGQLRKLNALTDEGRARAREAGGGAFNNTRGSLRSLSLIDYAAHGPVRE